MGVTGRAIESVSHLPGMEIGNLASDEVLSELRKTDQGKRKRNRRQIIDGGSRRCSVQPAENIEAVVVIRGTLSGGLVRERRKEGRCGSQEGGKERPVDIVEGEELIKVDL